MKYQLGRKHEQDDFNADAWGEQEEQGQVDFFEEEGRDLIREGPSRKRLPLAPIGVTLTLHVICLVCKLTLAEVGWLWYTLDAVMALLHVTAMLETNCSSKRVTSLYQAYH